ncbi:MAG: hypothetical protein GY715_18600 [Planctomycetes bacterium]|nr:hypothetical protein [Planctomycetota bacterium]
MDDHDSSPRPVRLGFICSSGGGLIDALCTLREIGAARFDVAGVVTDRPCGAETVAATHSIANRRIEDADADRFSEQAATSLGAWGATHVLLLFLRRVGAAVWRDLDADVWNLHPSLLPEFRGLDALNRSRAAGADQIGVTLHRAIAEPDAGPVLAQARFPAADAPTSEHAEHLCFLLKLVLSADALHRASDGTLGAVAQSALADEPWDGAFRPGAPAADVLAPAARFARPWARPWLATLHPVATP